MAIILFALFGLVVGFVARAVMPGRQKMGLLGTTALGVVGSFIGGLLVSLVTNHSITELTTAGFFGSVIGALVILAITSKFFSHRALV